VVPGPPTTDRLRRAGLLVWAAIGTLVLVAVGVFLAAEVRIIWLPLAFALGLVILMDPMVRGLERIAIPRLLGTVFAFVVVIAFIVAIGFLVVPTIREQAAEFGASLPSLYDEVVDWLRQTGDRLGIDLGPVWTSETIQSWIQDPANQETIQQLVGGFGSGAGRILAGVAEVVVVTVLAPVLAFYLLLDLPRSRRMMLELTPPRLRDEVAHVTSQVGRAVSAFVRGQLLVALIVGTLSSIGLWVLHLPFWLIIGMAAGLLNMVPFIGPWVGAGLAVIVALLEGEPTKALLAVVIFTAIQQVDNHIITPLVQRTRVRLSPLVIVLSLIIGGSIAGVLGVLVAVPTVSVIRIVAGHLWRTRVLGESWEQASEAMLETTEPPDRLRPGRRRVSPDQEKLFDTAELRRVGEGAPAVGQDVPERAPGPNG
jgi:predicted PurR-regulated permease PerM